jgi:hypothetical protein
MSAATAAVPANTRAANSRVFPLKAGAIAFSGCFGALTTGGLLRDAVAANTTDKIVGINLSSEDNSGGADSAASISVGLGIYEFAYTGTAPTRANIGANLYIADNQTVTLSATGTPPLAGTLFDVSPTNGKCFVKLG